MKVAVVGAGYAGLAAAVELAAHGIPVEVFEAGSTLGGRGRGIEYRGVRIDNGQHLLIGAYRELLRLMRLIGASDRGLARFPLRLSALERFDLRAAPLPAPFNVLIGLLRAEGLTASERWRAVKFMTAMRLARFRLRRDCTVSELLMAHAQNGALARYLWEPLCLAALNTPPASASAQVFLTVLRDGLVQSRAASDLLLPRVDLSELFPTHAARYIATHGGNVHMLTPALAIEQEQDGYAIRTRDMASHATHVVCAVGPHQLHHLAAPDAALESARKAVASYRYEPICTIYLRYDGSTSLPFPMVALPDASTQWLIDHEALGGTKGLIAAVISASGPHEALPVDVLASRVASEIASHFPRLREPLWSKVITERFATFACVPGLARPPQRTAQPNFFLAGDYTEGEYPATLEGAVRSGVKCAQLILEQWQAKS